MLGVPTELILLPINKPAIWATVLYHITEVKPSRET